MVVQALDYFSQRADIDIVLLMRGGGSKSDLAAFDEESIALAIARCQHPVFTGIGHQVDRSIADEVAHTACKTPTACADAVIEHVSSFLVDLQDTAARIANATRSALQRSRTRLTLSTERLRTIPNNSLERQRQKVMLADQKVRLLDPSATLARGWSITRDSRGDIVRDASSVSRGEELVTTVHGGTVRSTVTEVEQ
jgi:exodeoxyribonuclease VII large subunit